MSLKVNYIMTPTLSQQLKNSLLVNNLAKIVSSLIILIKPKLQETIKSRQHRILRQLETQIIAITNWTMMIMPDLNRLRLGSVQTSAKLMAIIK